MEKRTLQDSLLQPGAAATVRSLRPSVGSRGGVGCAHRSKVTLQPVYWAPRLLLWNNGPS